MPEPTKWIQINIPRSLAKKIDELISEGKCFYPNRNQFAAAVLIKEVEKIIDRDLDLL
jgi:metal-responsive CopG/Arc/MetJ family transcriptional regulator